MDYLAAQGASVPRPVYSARGEIIEQIDRPEGLYLAGVIEKAAGVRAEELPFDQWDEGLFYNIGVQVGKMHAIARGYAPSGSKRPDWDSAGSEFHPALPPEAFQGIAGEKLEPVQRLIAALPKDRDSYGLIHCDLHFGNFFIETHTGRVTVFDFDDCAYGWYIMDTALLLFDILVVYPRLDREAFAARFLEAYWRGYLQEMPLSAFWARQLPLFLKLLELNIYASYRKYEDPDDRTSWLGKFYQGRKERLEQDLPYLQLDFEALLARVAVSGGNRPDHGEQS
jgi:Ser/Thr protein kinase RdoA (MazF antagonist)